jgi:hypothetical protein
LLNAGQRQAGSSDLDNQGKPATDSRRRQAKQRIHPFHSDNSPRSEGALIGKLNLAVAATPVEVTGEITTYALPNGATAEALWPRRRN